MFDGIEDRGRGHGNGGGGSSSSYDAMRARSDSGGGGGEGSESIRVKRAKSMQKIRRHRKITSCLQCRERKQKCDRLRPVCSNCMAGHSRGSMCTYVDTRERAQEVLANEEEQHAKRVKPSTSPSSNEDQEGLQKQHRQTQSPERSSMDVRSHSHSRTQTLSLEHSRSPFAQPTRPMMLPARSPLTVRRLNLITATVVASRDRSLDFEARVRYARAAAVGLALFGEPPINAHYRDMKAPLPQIYQPLAAVDSLKLPTAAEIGPFLDTYRRHVEWMCNVVLVDLNRARFEAFLNWWHSNPQTLPADPPLIPLFLTVLALAIQARRMAPHCTLTRKSAASSTQEPSSPPPSRRRAQSPRDPYLTTCSAEKELLETAARCMDTMQIICPSNWASAFSAPLDLVRASLLRGLWHTTELHLQFAGSCLAATTRLAHAASLNHDTRHWPMMGKEEAQARRNIFWNVATIELNFSARVTQPSMILPSSYDTGFPDDFAALINLYRYGGLIEPYIVEGRRSHHRVKPVTRASFDFHLVRFQLTDILIKGQDMLRTGRKSAMAEAHEQWLLELPLHWKSVLQTGGTTVERHNDADGAAANESALDRETHYLQASLLQMMNYSIIIQIHRPQADETGQWQAPDGQAQRSLETCIDSAQRMIWLVHAVVTRDPGPPFVVFHQCIFYCFQAAIVIAIQSALSNLSSAGSDAGSNFAAQARPSLDKALLTLDLVAQQEGLRYLAEQAQRYAATLREIGAAQQRTGFAAAQSNGKRSSRPSSDKNGRGMLTATLSRNVQRTGLGVPAMGVAEGDGKVLGGQGYPSGAISPQLHSGQASGSSPSSTAHPLAALETQSSGTATPRSMPAKMPFNRSAQQSVPELLAFQSFTPSGGNRRNVSVNEFGGADSSSPGFPSMMSMFPQSADGIDFNDLQVFGPSDIHHRFDVLTEESFMDRATPSISFYSGSAPAQQQQQQHADAAINASRPSTSTLANGLDLLATSMSPEQQQLISAPPLDSLGDSFLLHWADWENAVERLLYTER